MKRILDIIIEIFIDFEIHGKILINIIIKSKMKYFYFTTKIRHKNYMNLFVKS